MTRDDGDGGGGSGGEGFGGRDSEEDMIGGGGGGNGGLGGDGIGGEEADDGVRGGDLEEDYLDGSTVGGPGLSQAGVRGDDLGENWSVDGIVRDRGGRRDPESAGDEAPEVGVPGVVIGDDSRNSNKGGSSPLAGTTQELALSDRSVLAPGLSGDDGRRVRADEVSREGTIPAPTEVVDATWMQGAAAPAVEAIVREVCRGGSQEETDRGGMRVDGGGDDTASRPVRIQTSRIRVTRSVGGGAISGFGLEAAALRQQSVRASSRETAGHEEGGEVNMQAHGRRKRPAAQLSRGFPSGDRIATRVRNSVGEVSGRPLPSSELFKMKARVRIRTAPFSRGGVTWTTKPKESGGRPGAGVACENEEAAFLKLWDMYKYDWVKEIQEARKC